MSLSSESKKRFKALGHNLKPVVTLAGNGLSNTVATELERALEDHELIKIKLAVEDRAERRALIDSVCARCRAELVQIIGKVALIYRPAQKPSPRKSNVL